MRLKAIIIPAFCLLHVTAIIWWTLPHSFSDFVAETAGPQSFEARLFGVLSFSEAPRLASGLTSYVNLTGSQQYWDFFAPHTTSSVHQYLSVCGQLKVNKETNAIACQDYPYFTNLTADFAEFRIFGSGRSRIYRLTENLINLLNPATLGRFGRYYANQAKPIVNLDRPVFVISHTFELHPELADLPREGYRSDRILLALP